MSTEPTGESSAAASELSPRPTELVTLLATDLVDSMRIKQMLGDQVAVGLIQQHQEVLRRLLAEYRDGEEIETAGDSFLLLFTRPSRAVRFALALQERMSQFSARSPMPMELRIGVHLGEVVMERRAAPYQRKNLYGGPVDICFRIMQLAQGGQVLLSRPVFDNARAAMWGADDVAGSSALRWLSHGPYRLKGVDEPVEVCEVRRESAESTSPPPNTEKAHRIGSEEEIVRGWRPAVGQQIPGLDWRLTEKLGEGGFGEVWLARHQHLGEQRVFKFCFRADRVRSLKREVTLFRLLRERIGEHPNIVRLFDVFLDHPPFYISEEYVCGRDLRSWCKVQGGVEQVDLETRIEIVAQAADALQAAHEAGVIHRDVKPGNILICRQIDPHSGLKATNPKAGPLVKLTDFGIGQLTSLDASERSGEADCLSTALSTASLAGAGTHLYLAPELVADQAACPQSDLYSLGVVLYQLLVGDFQRPLATDWAEAVDDPLLRDDLRRCFAGRPCDRLASAGELAWRLRSLPERRRVWMREQAAIAMRESAAYWRGVVLTAGLSAVVLAVMGMLVLALLRKGAEAHFRMAQAMRVSSQIGHRVETLAALQKAAPFYADRDAVRDEALAALALRDLVPVDRFAPELQGGTLLAMDPAFRVYATNSPAGAIIVRDRLTHAERFVLPGVEGRVRALVVSPGAQYLASYHGEDGALSMVLWSAKTCAALLSVRLPGSTRTGTFHPETNLFAFGTHDTATASIQIVELAGETASIQTKIVPDPYDLRQPRTIRFHPTAPYLAEVAEGSHELRLWDTTTRRRIGSRSMPDEVLDCAWHPALPLLVVACKDGNLYLMWCDPTAAAEDSMTECLGEPVTWGGGHHDRVLGVAFSPAGDLLASVSADRTLRLWPTIDLTAVRSPYARSSVRSSFALRLEVATLEQVRFSRDGQTLAARSRDGSAVRLWRVLGGEQRCLQDASSPDRGRYLSASFSRSGDCLAAADAQGVTVWSLSPDVRLGTLDFRPGETSNRRRVTEEVAFASGQTGWDLLIHSGRGLVHQELLLENRQLGDGLHLRSNDLLVSREGVGAFVRASGTGRIVAAVLAQLEVYSAEGALEYELKDVGYHCRRLAISPDGRWVAALRPVPSLAMKGAPMLEVYDLAEPDTPPTLLEITADGPFGFSPDSRWLVLAHASHLRFYPSGRWNGRQQVEFAAQRGEGVVGPFAWSPDGRLFAIASGPGKIQLYQVPELPGSELVEAANLETPDRRLLRSLVFSPRARRLAGLSWDRHIQLWDLAELDQRLAQLRLGAIFSSTHRR